MQGDLLVLRQLIAGGADVDTRDEGGTTPAMFAANRGYMELVQALIEAGCNLSLQGNDGHTALMDADPKRLDIVELLLKNGADPKIRGKAGRTAFEEALIQAQADPPWLDSAPSPAWTARAAAWKKKAAFLKQYEG